MRIIILISTSLILSACATNPKQEYVEILEWKSSTSINNPHEAVSGSTNIPLIKEEKLDFYIDKQDPTINLDGIISFYEIFSIEANSGESLSITSFSPIKSSPILYIVWPRIFIIDSEGNIIQDSMENGKISRGWGGIGPLQFQADWNFTASKKSTYYILVTSDNRVLDQNMASTTEVLVAGTVYVPWSYGFKAHSTGPMKLQWN